MNSRQLQYIDAMVKKTLYEMIEDWSEVEQNPYNVYMFAAKKLDFPVTQEEVKDALRRRLKRALSAFSHDDEALAEFDQEMCPALQTAMSQRGIAVPSPLTVSNLCQIDWEQQNYETLQAVHEVVNYYSGPDLLYEYQKSEIQDEE